MVSGVTHSVSESSYSQLDLAITRCDYLASRTMKKNKIRPASAGFNGEE